MLRVRTVFTGVDGGPWYNNLHFLGNGPDAASDAHDAVVNFWQDIGAIQHTDVDGVVESEVLEIDPATGDATGAYAEGDFPVGGVATGEILPPSLQGLIRLNTGQFVGGRRVGGRIFVPGLTETYNESGSLSAAGQTVLQDAINVVLASTTELVVYSRRYFDDVTVANATVWSEFAVLRSRRD